MDFLSKLLLYIAGWLLIPVFNMIISRFGMLIESTIISYNGEVETRTWSDLPIDLLSSIADYLGPIELLNFRSVCKSWLSASSTALARIEPLPKKDEPWFLLYGENSQCHIYNEARKYCSIDIPELYGATCLASIEGWLLLFRRGSIFFFCPFSRAKISLPQFPHQEVSTLVAAFSAPPTSQECIVAVLNRRTKSDYVVYVLTRGAGAWTEYKYSVLLKNPDTVKFALYNSGMGGMFIFHGIVDPLFSFFVKYKYCQSCIVFRGVSQQTSSNQITLRYTYDKNYFIEKDMKTKLGLGDDVSISLCGAILRSNDRNRIVYSDSIKAAEEYERRSLKGVWIQPRFFQISPILTW